MTVARRLTAIEADLDPTQRVVAWLAEAHAYDAFDAYARLVLADDPPDLPLDRLPREAVAAVRRRHARGSAEVEAAVREEIRGVVFRFHLAVRIIDVTDAALRQEALVHALLTTQVGLTLEVEERAAKVGIHLTSVRDLMLQRVAGLPCRRRAARSRSATWPATTPCFLRRRGTGTSSSIAPRNRPCSACAWPISKAQSPSMRLVSSLLNRAGSRHASAIS